MTEEKDPLEGFQITDYDPATETVTVQIHRRLLQDERQKLAVANRCVEIIEHGPSISTVNVEPRPDD